MIIYLVTNLINNKSYVGQTVQELKKRWNFHCSSSGCKALNAAIKMHGKDNFLVEALETCLTKDEMNEKERFYIKQLNTIAPNGYNISLGGTDGTFLGRTHTQESKDKISKRLIEIGHKAPVMTPEQRKAASDKLRGRKNGPPSEETRLKISIKNSGENHGMFGKGHIKKTCMPILCVTTNQVFYSQAEAARVLNVSQSCISLALKGFGQMVKGLEFKKVEGNYGK